MKTEMTIKGKYCCINVRLEIRRIIALVMERVVNRRLVWLLEQPNLMNCEAFGMEVRPTADAIGDLARESRSCL